MVTSLTVRFLITWLYLVMRYAGTRHCINIELPVKGNARDDELLYRNSGLNVRSSILPPKCYKVQLWSPMLKHFTAPACASFKAR